MHFPYADGTQVYRLAYYRGLRPDPDLWVDEWADEYMRIPRDTGAQSLVNIAPRGRLMLASPCAVCHRLTPANVWSRWWLRS